MHSPSVTTIFQLLLTMDTDPAAENHVTRLEHTSPNELATKLLLIFEKIIPSLRGRLGLYPKCLLPRETGRGRETSRVPRPRVQAQSVRTSCLGRQLGAHDKNYHLYSQSRELLRHRRSLWYRCIDPTERNRDVGAEACSHKTDSRTRHPYSRTLSSESPLQTLLPQWPKDPVALPCDQPWPLK